MDGRSGRAYARSLGCITDEYATRAGESSSGEDDEGETDDPESTPENRDCIVRQMYKNQRRGKEG